MKLRTLSITLAFLSATVAANAGVWGYGSFQNDEALDWVENVLKFGGQKAVEQTIARVATGRSYLSDDGGCDVVAACEILAAAQGRGPADLPKEIASLAKQLSSKQSDAVRKNARDALDRVLGKDSGLNELWKESGDNYDKWKQAVEELKSRV